MKTYKNKKGEIVTYDYSEKEREYNQKRNKIIWNLQKRKSFYKRHGNMEKAKMFESIIQEEKRKLEMEGQRNER